jgi:predicted NBD/HSP70 family sugar kinase
MALLRAAEDAVARKQATQLSRVEGPIDVAAIAAAAAQGDTVASRILAHGSEHLGRGISFLLNILNPEMIVLGGPVIEAGEPFLHAVRASVAHHALLPHGVAIVPSTLGDRVELTGSVLLAMESTVRSYRIVGSHDARARGTTEP